MLALLGVLCAAAVVLAVRSKAGRAALAGLLRRNLVTYFGHGVYDAVRHYQCRLL